MDKISDLYSTKVENVEHNVEKMTSSLFTVYKLRQAQGMIGSTVTRKVRLCETAL